MPWFSADFGRVVFSHFSTKILGCSRPLVSNWIKVLDYALLSGSLWDTAARRPMSSVRAVVSCMA